MRFGRINLLCCLLIHISGVRLGSGQITWIRRYVFAVDLHYKKNPDLQRKLLQRTYLLQNSNRFATEL